MSVCPGDSAGHHWHLEAEESWREAVPKLRWRSWQRVGWTLLGLLVPIIGWTCIVCYAAETLWRYVGVKRRWYCELCRAFEVTEHRDTRAWDA